MGFFRSIRTKLLAVVALTTVFALVVSGIAIFLYELNSFKTSRIDDLSAQVDLLSYSAAPALQFLDDKMARENIDLLRSQPAVSMAAIYDGQGNLFASYVRSGNDEKVPQVPAVPSITESDDNLAIYKEILADGKVVGTAFIRADYALRERGIGLLEIQAAVALGALLVAVALSIWLQSLITKPVLSIAGIARDVVARKEFARRATKISDDEVGTLVDAFNDMLEEIQARTSSLETSNRELEQEIMDRKAARAEILWLNSQLESHIQELQEQDRNKNDFLATLAHELRNPLAPIRSGMEILRKVNDERREQIYSIIERQTWHLIQLVDDLMDVSRISRGKVALKMQTVVLSDVIQVAADATSELMKEKRHTLTVRLPEAPVLLHGDPVRLAQVFLNLLSNAANYTHAQGAISLTALSRSGVLEVVVEDNGIGMEPGQLEKVFEAFIQLESPLAKSRGGLGIGLTLTRALIKKHGGTIHAESAGHDKGSRFVVMLPLAPADSVASQSNETATALIASHRILVVDDNEDAAATLSMQLRLAGHQAQVASSGTAALEIAKDFKPEVVLMDIGMPGLNGLDTARLLRQQPGGKDVLLIAVTGWGQTEDKQMTRDAGFDHHLVKPVRGADIARLLSAGTPAS